MLRKKLKIFVKYRKKVAKKHSNNAEIYLLYLIHWERPHYKGLALL